MMNSTLSERTDLQLIIEEPQLLPLAVLLLGSDLKGNSIFLALMIFDKTVG